ncbi:phage distal tail protein [uncultured Robinsoniella sp.]|uniref:phage distal tail protein n=1 Tax=uncultured Robinsoniella sp. TaxID=904190 RepID=UPI002909D9F0|nr:phage tail family protein [Clostridiales bacterium]
MTIDGFDVSRIGIRQWNFTPGYSELKNESEWLEGTKLPLMVEGKTGFKKIKVVVMVKGANRQEIWERGGKLMSMLYGPVTLKIDGFKHYFKAVLNNRGQAEDSLNRFHRATLEFLTYEFGEEKVVSKTNAREIEIVNEGTLETPAVIEIMPTMGKESLTITGITRDKFTKEEVPTVIKKLSFGKKIVIDGEDSLITEGGTNKFKDTIIYSFPSLLPGENTIILDQDDINITVRYKPMFV